MGTRRQPTAGPVLVAMLSAALTAAVPPFLQTRDIDEVVRDLFHPAGSVGVILFVASDCPVSNGYAPEIQRICDGARNKRGNCTLVYEDSSIDATAVRAHRDEYRYRDIPAVIDHGHGIARRARDAIRAPGTRSMSRTNTCPSSRPARSCASD